MSKKPFRKCHKDHAACVQSAQMRRLLQTPIWQVEGLIQGTWYMLIDNLTYEECELWIWIFDSSNSEVYERIRIVQQ